MKLGKSLFRIFSFSSGVVFYDLFPGPTGGQDEESERRQAKGGGGPGHEHQKHHHHRPADDADAVRGSLHVGDQLRLLQPQYCAGLLRTRRVRLD